MKFLLVGINAKYIHSNPAIRSLAAYAGENMREYIELAEYTINQRIEDILADIYKKKPTAIGFSCYIWNWNYIREIIPEIKKLLPYADIWLGGPEVTYHADKLFEKLPALKGVIIGEGEETFKELLNLYVSSTCNTGDVNMALDNIVGENCYLDTEVLASIDGLCLKTGYTKSRQLTNLSQLPFLYGNLDEFENKIIYYESSRGCPYRCSYCLSSIDKKVRLRDINVVKEELKFFLDNRVKQVKFVDRTFNCNHDHAMEIWRYIYENDNSVTNFHFEVSADILREDELELLNKFRPGLAQLEIGVQSTNEKTIKAINRVMDVNKLREIVEKIRKGKNLHMHLDLIAGLPYEDYESFRNSFNEVFAMKPEQLQLGFLKVLKGSEMEERADEFGICYLDNPPYEVLYTKWLSYEDVLKLKQVEEMVELYYNSNQYTHTLEFLLHAFDSPFTMFEEMANYYREKGYFINSPSRAYRYEILYDFAVSKDAENAEIYKELLLFDLYLRENIKSRPSFAADNTGEEVKTYIREFYKKEEEERKYLSSYIDNDWKQLSKMTHLEPFKYKVWDVCKLLCNDGEENLAGSYVLFDYKDRNPLTYEAKIWIL